MTSSPEPGPTRDEQVHSVPFSGTRPDEALLLRLFAEKLWSEGRAKPVWYQCSTWVGIWTTEDRITWRTTKGDWVAQLERSVNSRHVSLALYKQAVYVDRMRPASMSRPGLAAPGDPVHLLDRYRLRWRVRR